MAIVPRLFVKKELIAVAHLPDNPFSNAYLANVNNKIMILRSLLHSNDPVCVSIIIPLHPPSADRAKDVVVLRAAVEKAKQYLTDGYGQAILASLLSSLDDLAARADMPRHALGIGLFVSAHVKHHASLFFPVEEKITVADSFEIRDLLFQAQYSSPYRVLHLTNKEAMLFEGTLGNLRELQDGNFPKAHEDTFEYNHPSPGPRYAGDATARKTEPDQSQAKKLRYERFLREIDTLLDVYLIPPAKLVIAGAESNLSAFKSQTRHGAHIAGQVKGNYAADFQRLSALAWDIVKQHVDQQVRKLIKELEEKIGSGLVVTDLHEIWRAAQEGRAGQLLVEKDYRAPGFLVSGNNHHLHLTLPADAHTTLPDAIDDLMETVLDKNGDVFLVGNGLLAPYQRIALIARY